MKKHGLIVVILTFYAQFLCAQVNVKDSVVSAPMFSMSYSFQLPGGDLAKRFGNNSSVGLNFLHKTARQWTWGLDWCYLFGPTVKENGILDSLKTDEGYLIDQNGEYGVVKMYERGWAATARFGRLFPLGKKSLPNRNSGFLLLGSISYLQHKIRIDDLVNRLPQLTKEYRKGYDRLSSGPSFSLFAGYLFLSNSKLINFFAGAEVQLGLTRNRRSLNYDTMTRDNLLRKDWLIGPKIGFIVPLYKRAPEEFYYD